MNAPSINYVPRIPVNAAEQYWIKRAYDNPEDFITYLTDGEKRPADHHKVWYAALKDDEIKKLLIVAPRESAKSTTLAFFMAWYISKHPFTSSLIVSVSAAQADKMLQLVKDVFNLPRYANVFPNIEIDNKRRNNQTEFSIKLTAWNGKELPYANWRSLVSQKGLDQKSASLFSAGITASSIIGKRVSGLALVDDPHDLQTSATEFQREKAEQQFNTYVIGALMENAKCAIVTTRWATDDLAGRVMRRINRKTGQPSWHTISIPAIDDDGNSYWPQHWSIDRLMEKRDEVGDYLFEMLYLNNPIPPSSTMFKPEHLTKDLPDPLPDMKLMVISCDFATTTAARSDYTVFTCIGRDHERRIFVLDMMRGKWNFREVIQRLESFAYEMRETYHITPMIFLENQNMTKPFYDELSERLSQWFKVEQISIKGTKPERAMQIQRTAETGSLFINKNMLSYPSLVSEMLSFSSDGRSVHDDIVDTLSLPFGYPDWGVFGGVGRISITSNHLR